MLKKNSLNKFLENYPLYKSFLAVENYTRICEGYTHPFYIHGETFTYYCEKEADNRTFEVEVTYTSKDFLSNMTEGRVSKSFLTKDIQLDYYHHFIETCKSCKEYKIDLLLHVWSDKPIPVEEENLMRPNENGDWRPIDEFESDRANIYIEKVGISPKINLKIDSSVSKYFDRETNNLYFKAIKSKHENLGIASFAYFRRIIETELLNIVKDISELVSSDNEKITELITEYEKTEKVYVIYENIFPFLPKSLQILGDNPIKLLYNQTSNGIHAMTDNDCLERAEKIDLLLKFVIQKIYEEKSELLNIRNAIKELKK